MDDDRDYERRHGAPELGPEADVLQPKDRPGRMDQAQDIKPPADDVLDFDLLERCPEL